MQHRKYILIIAISCGIMLLAFGRRQKKDFRFVVPKGWPQPAYNFKGNQLTPAGVTLGRMLFFDPLLSRDSTISCASCHTQNTAFTHGDHNLSHGIDGLKGKRNSGTLINLAWSTSFMWDGGVNNLEVQPLNPITSPVEMDSKLPEVLAKLNYSPRYRAAFYKAFKDSNATSQHLLKALAQFTLMLESYNSKYDHVMRREDTFTTQEANGYNVFKTHCASCHTEPLFTNNGYANNGLPVDTELNDAGRMAITQNAGDSLKFKIPTLRNIFVSAPYMHDGRFKVIEQVIRHYTTGIAPSPTLAPQLAGKITLSKQERGDLVLFLRTLTDTAFLHDKRYMYSEM